MGIQNILDEYQGKKELLQMWIDIKNYKNTILDLKSLIVTKAQEIQAHDYYDNLEQSEKDIIQNIIDTYSGSI